MLILKRYINLLLRSLGYKIAKIEHLGDQDIRQDSTFEAIYEKCKPFTMTSPERMYSLYQAVLYILRNNIPGDFVECGVWKGGSSMIIATTLQREGVRNRKIYLYDTFEGMSEPSEVDIAISGQSAKQLLNNQDKLDQSSAWCYSPIEEVRANIVSTGYPQDNLLMIKGKVEDTLQQTVPASIALLRLDTDWYESTKMEMNVLYPLLNTKGILIIDDFGHWEGAKRAIIEYFEKTDYKPFIHRIDYTGRLIIK